MMRLASRRVRPAVASGYALSPLEKGSSGSLGSLGSG